MVEKLQTAKACLWNECNFLQQNTIYLRTSSINIHSPPVFPPGISALHHSAYPSVWLSVGPFHPGGPGHLVSEPQALASYLSPCLNHFAAPEENHTVCNLHLAHALRERSITEKKAGTLSRIFYVIQTISCVHTLSFSRNSQILYKSVPRRKKGTVMQNTCNWVTFTMKNKLLEQRQSNTN